MCVSDTRVVSAQHVLLLTGTPLQNNLHELWVLLKFMFPTIFPKPDTFDEAYNPVTQEYDNTLLTKTHTLLMPFFLRRVKSDLDLDLPDKKEINVYLPLSKLQTECYRSILTGEVGGMLKEVLSKVSFVFEMGVTFLLSVPSHAHTYTGGWHYQHRWRLH